jgi:hypothetical protein
VAVRKYLPSRGVFASRNHCFLTITSNFSLKELGDPEKLPPSVVRRIDGICKVLEV